MRSAACWRTLGRLERGRLLDLLAPLGADVAALDVLGEEGRLAALDEVGELVDRERAAAVVIERGDEQLDVLVAHVARAELEVLADERRELLLVERAALELRVELAALRGLLGGGDGRHLRPQAHAQLHQCAAGLVDAGRGPAGFSS